MNSEIFIETLNLLKSEHFTYAVYDDSVFGSWYIELKTHRIVFDGRDFQLRVEGKNQKEWHEIDSITIRSIEDFHLHGLRFVEKFPANLKQTHDTPDKN